MSILLRSTWGCHLQHVQYIAQQMWLQQLLYSWHMNAVCSSMKNCGLQAYTYFSSQRNSIFTCTSALRASSLQMPLLLLSCVLQQHLIVHTIHGCMCFAQTKCSKWVQNHLEKEWLRFTMQEVHSQTHLRWLEAIFQKCWHPVLTRQGSARLCLTHWMQARH